MGDKTAIEWTDETWNPVRGCTRVSEGCRHCYAERVAARFSGDEKSYAGLAEFVTKPDGTREARWTGHLTFGHNLDQPLRWKKPRKIFVNSMPDLFHEAVPDEEIDKVFAVMALAPQHTFQILTKRPKRMRDYLTGPHRFRIADAIVATQADPHDKAIAVAAIHECLQLPNVWLGVSCEDQPTANARIPDLLATPAAVRFVSAEPLLGPINLERLRVAPDHHTIVDGLRGYWREPGGATKLDWIIVGGESGPNARPMHPAWARTIRDQCAAADVPFFFKQMTKKAPIPDDLMVREFPHAYT